MEKAIVEFLDHMQFERNASPLTIRSYRYELDHALAFFKEQLEAASPDPGQITARDVRDLIISCVKGNMASVSIQRKISVLRSFFNFLIRQDRLETNPAEGAITPRGERKLPKIISQDDVQRLLTMPSENNPQGLRDRAILHVLYSSGLRVSELVGLNLEDLNLDAGEARVMGKGRRERLAILGPPAVAAIRAWLPHREIVLKAAMEQPAVFVGFSNCRYGARISTVGVARLLKEYAWMACLHPEAIHPHLLRHAMATHLMDKGADIRAIQQMLGHAHIRSTQIYTQVSVQSMKVAFNSAHPRALHFAPGQCDNEGDSQADKR